MKDFKYYLKKHEALLAKEERKKKQIISHLQNGGMFYKEEQRYLEGYLCPASHHDFKLNFIYFDHYGSVSCISRKNIYELAESIIEQGFKPLKNDSFPKIF